MPAVASIPQIFAFNDLILPRRLTINFPSYCLTCRVNLDKSHMDAAASLVTEDVVGQEAFDIIPIILILLGLGT